MSKVHFFPDLSYNEAKNIEEKYNAADQEFLINKASDFICDVVSRSRFMNQKFLFICSTITIGPKDFSPTSFNTILISPS